MLNFSLALSPVLRGCHYRYSQPAYSSMHQWMTVNTALVLMVTLFAICPVMETPELVMMVLIIPG